MDKGLFHTSKIYKWKQNKEEAKYWLLCALRLGICKDIRHYMLQFLCDPIYAMEVNENGPITCWSETQLRLYAAIQGEENYVLFNTPPRSGVTTVLAGIVATMCLNATKSKRLLSIHISNVTTHGRSRFLKQVDNFLSSSSLDWKFKNNEVFQTEFFTVSGSYPRTSRGLAFDMYIVDNLEHMDPAFLFKEILPHLQMSNAKVILCGDAVKDGQMERLSRLKIGKYDTPIFHLVECDTAHLEAVAKIQRLYE